MKKSIKVEFSDGEFTSIEEFEYKDDCTIKVDDGIVYIRTDDNLQLGVNKDLFISFIIKRAEVQTPK